MEGTNYRYNLEIQLGSPNKIDSSGLIRVVHVAARETLLLRPLSLICILS